MSHQLPDQIKLEILKANQAHEVAMYWEKTKRRWVHLSATVVLASAFLAAIVSLLLGRPVELTPQTIPMLKPLLTNMHCSSSAAYPPTWRSSYSNMKMPGVLSRAFHDYLINVNNQGQQGISPVQQAAPIAQQVAVAKTTPGVAIAVKPAMIFNNFAFINTSLNKVDGS